MNEEEKKAIETLKSWKDYNIKNKNKLLKADEIINVQETILNLIEKLQKENEELREYIAIAPNLDKMTAIKYRNIRQDAYIQGRAEEQQKAEQIIYKNYISKQKIKDKIKELERFIYSGKKSTSRFFTI